MHYVLNAIDGARDGYVSVVRRLVRVAVVGLVMVAAVAAGSLGLFRITPQGFLPAEDQGAFFAAMRLPEGASVNRTEELVAQVENIVRPIPGVQGIISVVGLNFIDYVAASNQAFFVVRLKPTKSEPTARKAVDAIIARLRPQLAAIQGAIVFPFNLPPILGLGNTGGFQYALEALQGQTPAELAAVMRSLASPPISSPNSPASSAPSPPTRRRSASISTATRRRCWASRSATSLTRCSPRSAASTSTTSTFSAAPGR